MTVAAPETAHRPTARRPIADRFRRTAGGAVEFCVRHNIHPDVISWSSVFAAATAAACFLGARWQPWLLIVAPLACYARLWLNMLDGMVALASGRASRRGEIINELPDRLSDILIFAAVAHGGFVVTPAIAYWTALLAVMTAYVGMLGQAVGARREFGGVMAKPMRLVVLHVGAWATFALLRFRGEASVIAALTPLDLACLIVILGCVQTCLVRLRSTFKLLEKES
jgi:phosphatidylglycerophosphate synthase